MPCATLTVVISKGNKTFSKWLYCTLDLCTVFLSCPLFKPCLWYTIRACILLRLSSTSDQARLNNCKLHSFLKILSATNAWLTQNAVRSCTEMYILCPFLRWGIFSYTSIWNKCTTQQTPIGSTCLLLSISGHVVVQCAHTACLYCSPLDLFFLPFLGKWFPSVCLHLGFLLCQGSLQFYNFNLSRTCLPSHFEY